jgi:hypothetical protein
LRIRYDLDSKDIREAWSAIISESAEYQILTLLVEYQYARQHLDCVIKERRWAGEDVFRDVDVGEL